MFIDMEGTPVQELSALMMDITQRRVIAAYHKHAYCSPTIDRWARYHIHGLDPSILKDIGFTCEDQLISDFKIWYQTFSQIESIYGNNPAKESNYYRFL